MGQILLEKGRLRTLSSTVESRKFRPEESATETSALGVLYPVDSCFVLQEQHYNISRRGLSRVAYPGQGNARALLWDKRE